MTSLLKPISVQTEPENLTPATSATPLSHIEQTTPSLSSSTRDVWTKEWMAKYVIANSKPDYVFAMIDAETLHSQLESHHSSIAQMAFNLVHFFSFPKNASDLVKLDIVFFKNRDSYGAPLWDSVERIGHFEFSRKTLSQASPESFLKAEADWLGLFKTVHFFD